MISEKIIKINYVIIIRLIVNFTTPMTTFNNSYEQYNKLFMFHGVKNKYDNSLINLMKNYVKIKI